MTTENSKQKWDYYEEHVRTLSPEKLLRELLATLHGDGGHHTEDVGLTQSVIDAMNRHKSKQEYTLAVVREAVEEDMKQIRAEGLDRGLVRHSTYEAILSRIEAKTKEES